MLSYVPDDNYTNHWYFESWNCCPAGHKIKSKTVAISGPGEVLTGSMVRDAASGVWTITSTNAQGDSSVLQSDDTNSGIVKSWNWVDIVLETYNVDDCAQYSAGGAMKFSSLDLQTSDGASITPTNWDIVPYVNGNYLSPAEAAQFTACCNGEFNLTWPAAYMEQNAD